MAIAWHFERLLVPPGRLRALESLLSEEERAHAARFRFANDRAHFVARRGLLRERLAIATGCAPERLAFVTGAHGKPGLADGALHFNASASGEWMMLATADAAVGCDIERIDGATEWRGIADAMFAASERAVGSAEAFFRTWTRKEAVLKAAGTGFDRDPATFSTHRDTLVLDRRRWRLADVPAPPGYAAAIAARAAGTAFRISFASGRCPATLRREPATRVSAKRANNP